MANSDRKQPDTGHFPFDLGALLAPTLFCIFLALVSPGLSLAQSLGDRTLFTVALLLGSIGVVLLFLARLPLYRQEHFVFFGSRYLNGVHRRLYYVAYGFIAPCILLLLARTLF